MKIWTTLLLSFLMACVNAPDKDHTQYVMTEDYDDRGYSQIEFVDGGFNFLERIQHDNHAWPSITYSEYRKVATVPSTTGGQDSSRYKVNTYYVESKRVAHPETFDGSIGRHWGTHATLVLDRNAPDSINIRGKWGRSTVNWKFCEHYEDIPNVDQLRAEHGMWDGTEAEGSYFLPNGQDTTWWTFADGKVYMAERIKISNSAGYLPVKHYRGEMLVAFPDIREGKNSLTWNTYQVSLNFNRTYVPDDTIETTSAHTDEDMTIVTGHYEYQWKGEPSEYTTVPGMLWRAQYLVDQMDGQALRLKDVYWEDPNKQDDVYMRPWHQSLLDPTHNAYFGVPETTTVSVPKPDTTVCGTYVPNYNRDGEYVGQKYVYCN